MSSEVGAVSGLPGRVDDQREAIQELASSHHVRKIAYFGLLSHVHLFMVDSEPSYKPSHHARLTEALTELLEKPVVIYARDVLEWEWGNLMRETAQLI